MASGTFTRFTRSRTFANRKLFVGHVVSFSEPADCDGVAARSRGAASDLLKQIARRDQRTDMHTLPYPDRLYFRAAEGWLGLGDTVAAAEELDKITSQFH